MEKREIVDLLGNKRVINVIKGETNTLEKGETMNAFDYDKDFKIEKMGKEVKEKLSVLKGREDSQKSIYQSDLTDLLSKTSFTPNRGVGDWSYRGLKSKVIEKLGYEPKEFDWEMTCFSQEKRISYVIPEYDENKQVVEKVTVTEEQSKVHRDYNDKIRQLIDCIVELIKIESLERNLSDNKKYNLTPQQICALGF